MRNRLVLFPIILLCIGLLSACGRSLESVLTAIKEGDTQAIRQMIDDSPEVVKASTDTGDTVLFQTLRYGFEGLAKYSVQKGADVNKKNSQGVTPIFFVRTPEMAEFLIKHGADKHIKTYEGTPLHWAAKFDHIELVKFYIDEGLPLDYKSGRGNMALDLAIKRNNGEIVKVLESATGTNKN